MLFALYCVCFGKWLQLTVLWVNAAVQSVQRQIEELIKSCGRVECQVIFISLWPRCNHRIITLMIMFHNQSSGFIKREYRLKCLWTLTLDFVNHFTVTCMPCLTHTCDINMNNLIIETRFTVNVVWMIHPFFNVNAILWIFFPIMASGTWPDRTELWVQFFSLKSRCIITFSKQRHLLDSYC